jgi:hypothetical protein
VKNFKDAYTPRQQLNYEQCGCDGKSKPPSWLLDKIADEKLKGGFVTKKSNLCTGCYTYRSVNGTCGCP